MTELDGILVVDKPQACTSFDVVSLVRRLTKARKVGHSGTLDPMATGVLPIFLGSSTKLVKYFLNGDKGYAGEMTLGIVTDSFDADGIIVAKNTVSPEISEVSVKDALPNFTGKLKQVPPMVSAKHHKGQRLYELARKGITVAREPKDIVVHELKLLNFEPGDHPRAGFYCLCSKGSYIRSLVSEIGEALGCGAHLSKLRRVYSHPFKIEEAYSVEAVQRAVSADRTNELLLDPKELIDKWKLSAD